MIWITDRPPRDIRNHHHHCFNLMLRKRIERHDDRRNSTRIRKIQKALLGEQLTPLDINASQAREAGRKNPHSTISYPSLDFHGTEFT